MGKFNIIIMEVLAGLQKSNFLHGKYFSLGTSYRGPFIHETLCSLTTNCSKFRFPGTQNINEYALYHAKF
jgi:hypothetical protein